ncbi:MAG: hypothetical protein IJS69_06955 [Selenomonadaceae bacterium]|nr:hypothetical protein [Selenomonadaceae bacterium]
MRIYIDNCCFGRPFDNQEFLRISLETQAILAIQEQIKAGKLQLVTSYTLHYENDQSPLEIRKNTVKKFLKKYSSTYVSIESAELIAAKAEEFISAGVKDYDAYHVASAIVAECDYFLSVDDRLLKHTSDEIILINPVDFLKVLEGELK